MSEKSIYLITSMGATASTNLLSWASERTATNCPVNSEGLPAPGPGSNPKGLKHRIAPPSSNDPYLPQDSRIVCALYIWDRPREIVPSLFRRRIAHGHAIAITGRPPAHGNDIDRFVALRHDSFGFHSQFYNWISLPTVYDRLIIKFPYLWDHVDELLEFLDIDRTHVATFPADRRSARKSSFEGLKPCVQTGIEAIYAGLDESMARIPEILHIPGSAGAESLSR